MIPEEQSKLTCLPLSSSAQSPPKTQVTTCIGFWYVLIELGQIQILISRLHTYTFYTKDGTLLS